MTLEETVTFMKAQKILDLRLPDGTQIQLAPEALETCPEAPKPSEDGPDLDEMGTTGMTRSQQLELFGTVFEGDFPRKR